MKRFLVLLVVIMCVLLTGCSFEITREKTDVSATVLEKQHKESWVWYNPVLKMSQFIPEEYLVTISYEDVSETFDNRTIYETVKEGDSIQMILYKYYDENGNLLRQEIQFPE